MAASKKSAPGPAASGADGGAPKFEDALARLEQIIENLAEGDLPLEQSLAAYREGITLVKLCQKQLKDVEQEILKLTPDSNGEPQTEPFEDDEG